MEKVSVSDITSAAVRVSNAGTGSVRVKEDGQVFARNGHSPYIDDDTGTWWEFDDQSQTYVDTKVQAKGGITIDEELSDTSVNPVQNKAILSALNLKTNIASMNEIRAIDIDALWESV